MARHPSPAQSLVTSPLSRRSFVRTAAGVAGAFGAGVLTSCEDPPTGVRSSPPLGSARGGNGGGGKGGGASTRNPLRIPSAGSPPSAMTVGESTVDLGGGNLSRVWTYNGQFPGPTIVVEGGSTSAPGDRVTIDLYNDLADETITHWHGMIVDTPNDGHPHQAFQPGGSYHYDFPVVQRATMNWYHPHPHEKTGEQVAMGLAGGFIIRDSVERSYGLPTGPREIPLIVRDAEFDRSGNMIYKPRSGGFEGKSFLVNGTLDPTLSADAAVYRFRLMNGSNARIYRFAFEDGTPFTLIGNDGGFLPDASVTLDEMVLCPAERVDILVDLRGRLGDRLMLRDLASGWDLLEITVDNDVVDDTVVPATLPSIPSLGSPVREREFSFDGMSKINGQLYDMDRIDFQVPFGQTELWRFTTNGNAPHPVHVHGAYYQVISRTGGRGRLYPWETGWKDSVLLEDGETVEVLIRFDGYKGLYLMHCHKLEHEDMGMMSNFEVV